MEPKPIEPQDIRVGMRVRRTLAHESGLISTDEFTVRAVNGGAIDFDDHAGFAPDRRATWTLLADAPKPDRPVGSHWRGTVQTGVVEYVLNQHGDYLPVRMPEGWSVAALRRGYDDNEIACLTPVPAFDPATLWPCAPDGARWCRESDAGTGRVCTRHADHDGLHAAYGMDTTKPLTVWGDPR